MAAALSSKLAPISCRPCFNAATTARRTRAWSIIARNLPRYCLLPMPPGQTLCCARKVCG